MKKTTLSIAISLALLGGNAAVLAESGLSAANSGATANYLSSDLRKKEDGPAGRPGAGGPSGDKHVPGADKPAGGPSGDKSAAGDKPAGGPGGDKSAGGPSAGAEKPEPVLISESLFNIFLEVKK